MGQVKLGIESIDGLDKALRYRWLIFWILAVSYILVYFHRMCAAVVAVDMMRDLNANATLFGILGSAYFYPYAIMQLPAGLLSDSWGPRKTISVFFFLAFIGSIILGTAPNVLWAIIGRSLVGLGVSMLFVPTLKVLAEWFSAKEFAGMTGILIAMGGVGSISATTPLALMSKSVGWRNSFLIVGAVTALLAVLIYLAVRDRPEDMGWESPSADERGPKTSIGLLEGIKKVLSYWPFWPMAAWFFFNCAIFFAFSGLWGGPFLMHVYAMTKAQAGGILMMSALGMVIGSPLLSFLSNRLFAARKPLLVGASAITIVINAMLVFYTDRFSIHGLYFLCLMIGIFTNAIVVIGFTATKELFPVQIAGTSTGLVNLFPFFGGALLQPIMGYILERSGRLTGGAFTVIGYRHAFMATLLCAVIAFIASLFIEETLSKTTLS